MLLHFSITSQCRFIILGANVTLEDNTDFIPLNPPSEKLALGGMGLLQFRHVENNVFLSIS